MKLDDLKSDKDGNFVKNRGWKLTRSGKRSQPKFRLGKDRRKAKQRLAQIDLIWSAIEASNGRKPCWDETALEVAQAIAAGERQIRLRRLPDESIEDFGKRVRDAAGRFPGLQIVRREDPLTARVKKIVASAIKSEADALAEIGEIPKSNVSKLAELAVVPVIQNKVAEDEPTLWDAFGDFEEHIRREYPALQDGFTQEGELSD